MADIEQATEDEMLEERNEKYTSSQESSAANVVVVALILNVVFASMATMFLTTTNCKAVDMQNPEETGAGMPSAIPNDQSFEIDDENLENIPMNDAENFENEQMMDDFPMISDYDENVSTGTTQSELDCGHPTVEIGSSSGEDLSEFSWPWIVTINKGCSGILVAPAHVFTAAHCVVKNVQYHITYGSIDQTEHSEQRVAIVRTHPRYNNITHSFDIALLTLERPITTYSAMPICLPTGPLEINVNDKDIWTAGWATGRSFADSITIPVVLNEASLTLADCAVYGQKENGNPLVPEIISLCAEPEVAGRCVNDGGGPLISRLNNEWQVHGITSWSEGCTNTNPVVYSAVYPLRTWYCCYLSFMENCQGVICKNGETVNIPPLLPPVDLLPEILTLPPEIIHPDPPEEDYFGLPTMILNGPSFNENFQSNKTNLMGFQNEFNICKYSLSVLDGWREDGTKIPESEAGLRLYNNLNEQTSEPEEYEELYISEMYNITELNNTTYAYKPPSDPYAQFFNETVEGYTDFDSENSDYDLDSFYGGPNNYEDYTSYENNNSYVFEYSDSDSKLIPCGCGFMAQQYFDFLKQEQPHMYEVYLSQKHSIGMTLQDPKYCVPYNT